MKPGASWRPFLGLAALTLAASAAMAQTSFILRNGDVDKSGEVNDSDLTKVILDHSSNGPFPTANGWTNGDRSGWPRGPVINWLGQNAFY